MSQGLTWAEGSLDKMMMPGKGRAVCLPSPAPKPCDASGSAASGLQAQGRGALRTGNSLVQAIWCQQLWEQWKPEMHQGMMLEGPAGTARNLSLPQQGLFSQSQHRVNLPPWDVFGAHCALPQLHSPGIPWAHPLCLNYKPQ